VSLEYLVYLRIPTNLCTLGLEISCKTRVAREKTCTLAWSCAVRTNSNENGVGGYGKRHALRLSIAMYHITLLYYPHCHVCDVTI
jgi:hypothetical protein